MAKRTTDKAGKKAATRKAGTKRSGFKDALIDQVRELVELMSERDLSRIDIRNGEHRISLERGGAPAAAAPSPAPPDEAAEEVEPAEDLIEIKSPMVGTFYASPSPDSDPYVMIGSMLADDTVVCIVEAMKVMNEIQAGCSGKVVEICVKNVQPVEFGQVLFRVKGV